MTAHDACIIANRMGDLPLRRGWTTGTCATAAACTGTATGSATTGATRAASTTPAPAAPASSAAPTTASSSTPTALGNQHRGLGVVTGKNG